MKKHLIVHLFFACLENRYKATVPSGKPGVLKMVCIAEDV